MDNSIAAIKVIKNVPYGGVDSLEERLRKVGLRGFPEVRIYEHASFRYPHYDRESAQSTLSISQPHLHQTYLDRINELDKLFQAEGVDIFNLSQAYDYTAVSGSGETTEWTMLPPIVEILRVPRHSKGGFNYEPLLAPSLQTLLSENGWSMNEQAETAAYFQPPGVYHLINDGAHRVEAGLQSGRGITVLEIAQVTPGFPYYAAPQPYSSIKVFPDEATSDDLKIHVLHAPAHKQLYRVFPSGGIHSGNVRPARGSEVIL